MLSTNAQVLAPSTHGGMAVATHALAASYRIIRDLTKRPLTARVYLCEDRLSGELFVLQCFGPTAAAAQLYCGVPLNPPVRTDTTSASTVAEELRVMRSLQARPHPHVVHIVKTSDDTSLSVAVVMDYYARGDLFAFLEALPECHVREPEAIRFFREIVSGVQHLHALGFAHRDLSLENVLLDAHGRAKISDFRLCVSVGTQCFGCVGKPQYMAPEVVAGMYYDPVVADVWSLGIMFFILLTGSPLFTLAQASDPAWRALECVGVAGVIAQWGLSTRVSRATVEVLTQMLQIDPLTRVQSLAPVLHRLATM